MEDESRFNEKWDFRRKETDFDDSSSDDNQNSKSFLNPKGVLDHDKPYHRSKAEAVAEAEPEAEAAITKRSPKTRKRKMKKDENEIKKGKQVKRGRPKKIKEDNVMMNDVGKYVDTLLDDLNTSRENLLEWFKNEVSGSGSDQNTASDQPHFKKKAVEIATGKRLVKKRKSEKEKDDQNNNLVEECLEIVRICGDLVEEFDCNVEPLETFGKSGQSGLGIKYFQQHPQKQGQDQEEKCLQIEQNGPNQVQELDYNAEPLKTFGKSGQSGLGINYFHQHPQQRGQDQVEKCFEFAQNNQNQVQELDCNVEPLETFGKSGQSGLGINYFQQQSQDQVEKCLQIAQNGRNQVQELDCNVEPLETFWKSDQSGLGVNYFHQNHQQQQQQQQKRQKSVVGSQTDQQKAKTATFNNPKSIVLAIEAQNLGKVQKKNRGKTIKNNKSSSTNLVSRSETPKDHNFMIPFAPKFSSSSSSSFQSFPVPSSSMLPSSASQGIASIASNNNFQMRPISQIPADLSEFQTGQGYVGNYNNCYNPAAFQSNLITGLNFPVQVNPGNISQEREKNNMFSGLRMGNGAIRFSGNFQAGNFPAADVSNRNNGLPDYRTGSGR